MVEELVQNEDELIEEDRPKSERKQEDSELEKNMLVQANYTEDEEKEVLSIIETEMERISQEFTDTGWYQKIEGYKAKYDVAGESLIETTSGIPNIKIAVPKLITRLLAARAARQTVNADPMIVLSKAGKIEDDVLSNRQEILDFILRKKVKYPEYLKNDYERGIYQPCTLTKTSFRHSEESMTKVVEFTKDNIDLFKEVYGREEYDLDSEIGQKYKRIMAGETITEEVTYPKTTYHGSCIYNVPLEKFGARLSIKDFRNQTLIYEQLDYNWLDVQEKIDDPHSGWDKEKLQELINDISGEGPSYDAKKLHEHEFKFFECIVRYDRKKNGVPSRYIVVIDSKTKKFLKAIYHSFDNIGYTSRSVNPNDKSWAGESLLDMINEVVAIINSTFNSYIYENDLAHTPIVLTDDSGALTRKTIQLGHVNVLPFKKGSTFQQVKHEFASQDRVAFFNMLMQLAFLLCGVDPLLVGGAQSINDPGAGVGKTALKLQATSQRMKDMIINLQYPDAEIAEQIEQIEYEYRDGDDINIDGKKVSMRDVFGHNVLYSVHGSEATFDRQQDVGLLLQMMQIIVTQFPGIWKDEEVKKSMLNTLINVMGGSVEQMRDVLLDPISSVIDIKKILEKFNAMRSGKVIGQEQGQEAPQAQSEGFQGGQGADVGGTGQGTVSEG